MVKYGQCTVRCKQCGKGCGVRTQIQRNKHWERDIVSQVCEHFSVKIDVFTRNTYTPFGKPDCIRFEVFYTPVSGGAPQYFKKERTSCNDGYEEHFGDCLIEMHWSGNSFGDYLGNTLLGVGWSCRWCCSRCCSWTSGFIWGRCNWGYRFGWCT